MKKVIFLLTLLSSSLFSQVTNITVTNAGTSTASVVFQSTSAFTGLRILWAASPNTCTSGGTTGGGTYTIASSGTYSAGWYSASWAGISGATSFQVCPEVLVSGVWSTGAGATLTLANPINNHNPMHPAVRDTSFPDLTTGTCSSNSLPGYCTVVLATPCIIGSSAGVSGSLNQAISNAIANQETGGTIIEIPAGQVCNDSNVQTAHISPDAIFFDASQVANNTITMPNALSTYTKAGPNGIVEGMGVLFSQYMGSPTVALPKVTRVDGSTTQIGDNLANGGLPYAYYIHITGASTFQLYWPWTHIDNVNTISGKTSIEVTSLFGTGGDTPGIAVNALVSGTGIPAGTTVTSISGTDGQYIIGLSSAITITGTTNINFGGGDTGIAPIEMPLPIIAGSTTTGQHDVLAVLPRDMLYTIDIRSCVDGVNCIASWSSATTYNIGDDVTANGNVYQAIATNTNQAPPNATYWMQTSTLVDSLYSTLPPLGNRISPAWAPNLAVIEKPISLDTPEQNTNCEIGFGNTADGWGNTAGVGYLNSNIRFDDLQLSYDVGEQNSADPIGHEPLICTGSLNTNIDFSQLLAQNLDQSYQNAVTINWAQLDGRNIAITDSYIDNMTYWHSVYYWGKYGMPDSQSACPGSPDSGTPCPTLTNPNSVVIPATQIWYGTTNPVDMSSDLTVSWTGTPDSSITTPEIMVYYDMSNNLNVIAPSGMIVATSPQTSIITYTTTSGNMDCDEQDPLMPKDIYNRQAGAPLGCIQISSGGLATGNPVPGFINSYYSDEGCNCLLASDGPGPYKIANDFFQFTGIGIHFDNGGNYLLRHDYDIYRNTWHYPMDFMPTVVNQYARAAAMLPNGLNAAKGHTQSLEWKAGSRIWIHGNIFDGVHGPGSDGFAFDLTPSANNLGYINYTPPGSSDVEADDNILAHIANGFSCPNTYVLVESMAHPSERCKIDNNLVWDMNGLVYATIDDIGFGVAGFAGKGALLGMGNVSGDTNITHNTVFPQFGTEAQWIETTATTPAYGLDVTNNILVASNNAANQVFLLTGCNTNNSATLTNCFPDANFTGNLIIPGFSNGVTYPATGTQYTDSQVESLLTGYTTGNTFITPVTNVGSTLATIGWLNINCTGNFSCNPFVATQPNSFDSDGNYIGPEFDFKLLGTYTHQGSTDGLQEGANINQVNQEVGKVTLIGATSITSTNASISFVAPDSVGCPVDYSASDSTLISSFTRVKDSGGSRTRNIPLSGLTSGTLYYYRVDCATEQPTGIFRTHN